MSLPRQGEKTPAFAVGPFGPDDARCYAAASGDDNPLHVDAALASAIGFAAPPVHGMRLMAAVEPALKQWRPDLRLTRLSGTFAEPLLLGEAATLSARVLKAGERDVLLRVMVQGPRRGPSLVAEAVLEAA
ncbi:MAG: hypothetical protein KGL46_01460 [Hyphomicrobiales bacterium]|nr:hypothetical protein [Hyphomicrobiales bacterium]